MEDYAIHWFRRDLRVHGNICLKRQFSKFNGRVVGFFCFDKSFLSRDDFSANRFQFFIETLSELKKELKSVGSDLYVVDALPEKGFQEILSNLKKRPTSVSFSRDYEPFALARDKKIKEYLESEEIDVYTNRDHLLIEPWELSKGDGDPYKVYTPFSRTWLDIFEKEKIYERVNVFKNSDKYLKDLEKDSVKPFFKLKWDELLSKKDLKKDSLEEFKGENLKNVTIDIPPAGSIAAYNALKDFSKRLDEYKEARDIPKDNGTSRLSHFLKNGSLTSAHVMYYYQLNKYSKKDKSSKDVYFSELIWREFYYHVLYHFPHVETKAFNEKYENLKWENNDDYFKAWKEGKTGFPIVDAGMRELNSTGHMHNRVRMIVASFLTKDLLIDWRWGEKYFMDKLLDGDLAANNGGWQWAASTGCDAQPYFRIFNPWTQSKRFDPQGDYIKKYIPE